jgi:hypothetical protein
MRPAPPVADERAMIQNDYIMKMIAQLHKVLLVVLKLKQSGRDDDALREIDRALQRIVGLNSQLVNSLTNESLAATLRGGTELDVGKALVVADMLSEEASIYRARGAGDEADARYFKALFLHAEALNEDVKVDLSEFVPKMSAVEAELGEYALPISLREKILMVYERHGDFATAEDILFDMLEDDAGEEAYEIGRAFYERLLARTDEELATGNLPREEVLDGLDRLGG